MGKYIIILSVYLISLSLPGNAQEKKPVSSRQQTGIKQGIVARVNDREISEEFFNAVYEKFLEDFRSFNPGSPVDEETRNWAKKYVLDEFIKREIIIQEARKSGFKVSDEEVEKVIKDLPYFKDKNGNFDRTKYLWAINDPKFNWNQVREQIRNDDELIYKEFQEYMMKREKVSDQEVLQEYKKRNEKVRIQCAVLKSIIIPDTDTSIISDTEVRFYFNTFKEKYLLPARVKAKYLLITPEKVRSGTQITNEEIENYYRENKDEFYLQERVKLRHILVRVPPDADTKTIKEKRDAAEKILGFLKAGEDFSEVAKKHSEDPQTAFAGGEIRGYIPKGRLRDLDPVLFSLKKGDISNVVKTPLGFHIFKIEDKKPAGIGSLDEVMDRVRDALLKKKSEEKAKEVADKIAGEVRTITELESRAIPYGGLIETPLFSERDSLDTIGYIPDFNRRAFALKVGEIDSGAIPLEWRPGKIMGYAVLAVISRSDSELPAFEEIKNTVRNDYKKEKEKELTLAQAEEIIKKVKGSSEFETLTKREGCETKEVVLTRFQYYIEGIGYVPDLVKTSFDSTPSEAGLIKDTQIYKVEIPAGICIYRPVERIGIDWKAFEKEKESLRQSLAHQKNAMAFDKWYEEARSRAKIEIYLKVE